MRWRVMSKTILHEAIRRGDTVEHVQALVEARPGLVLVVDEDDGNPLWVALRLWMALHRSVGIERLYDYCKILVAANNEVLRSTANEGVMESPLGFMGGYDHHFGKLNDELQDSTDSIEDKLRTYGNDEDVCYAFPLTSMLVKADYHAALDDDILGRPILHAIAGCRDPFFAACQEHCADRHKGFISLSIRASPEQLLQADENGSLPLHIAASTTNRDKSDYSEWVDFYSHPYEVDFLQQDREAFMEDFCQHHWFIDCYLDVEDYIAHNCECDHGQCETYGGCQCGNGEEDLDGGNFCSSCYRTYLAENRANCHCHDDYQEIMQKREECTCEEAFQRYHAKMNDKHRGDKFMVIKLLAETHPEAASFRDGQGMLPIHLAIANGKVWDKGVRCIAEAYPDGVLAREPHTKLYPFMKSASDNDLDNAFELLRFRPDVLYPYCRVESGEHTANESNKKRKLGSMN